MDPHLVRIPVSFLVSMVSCYNGENCQWHQRSESEVRSLVFMYSMGQKGLVNLVSFHLSVVVSEKAQDTLLELKN